MTAVIVLAIIVGLAVLTGVIRLVYSLTNEGRNTERMRRLGMFLIVGAFLSVSLAGCGNGDDKITPTAEVITGVEEADSIITDTIDGANDVKSALCKACLIGELLGGDNCNCNTPCNTELVCQDEGDD